MAILRVLLCVFLLVLSFSICETRVLDPVFSDSRRSSVTTKVARISEDKQEIIERHFESKKPSEDEARRALKDSAREMFKQSVKRQEISGMFLESKRVSPGGPDPHHH